MDVEWIQVILNGGVVAVAAVFVAVIAPWVKEHVKGKRHDLTVKVIDTLVEAAEQVYGSGKGLEKLNAVLDWAGNRGVDVGVAEVEAAVRRLTVEGYAVEDEQVDSGINSEEAEKDADGNR